MIRFWCFENRDAVDAIMLRSSGYDELMRHIRIRCKVPSSKTFLPSSENILYIGFRIATDRDLSLGGTGYILKEAVGLSGFCIAIDLSLGGTGYILKEMVGFKNNSKKLYTCARARLENLITA